jgi:hypothetical protein
MPIQEPITVATPVHGMQPDPPRLSIARAVHKINKTARQIKRWRLRRRVALTRPSPQANVRVRFSPHCLTSHDHLLLAICSAKSLNLAMEEPLPWVFHDDGSLTRDDGRLLCDSFPGCRLVERSVADQAFLAEDLRVLGQARQKSVLLLKLADLRLFARCERVLYVDSDIVFFSRPDALIRAIADNTNYFTRDIATAYVATLETLETITGIRPLERVNSGIFVINRSDIGLDVLAERLSQLNVVSGTNAILYNHLIEQTLVSLMATASAAGAAHLPPEYDLYLGRGLQNAVCRHYVGVIRELFELEGLDALLTAGDFVARWERFATPGHWRSTANSQ